MANVGCFIQRSACAIRVARLGSDCFPVAGAGNGAIASAIATMTATPDVTEGTRFNPSDACGRTVFSASNPNVTNRYNVDLEIITTDYELIEIMTSASLILGAADAGPSNAWAGLAIGIARPGPTTTASYGVGLDIWVKNGSGDGPCGPASTNPPYVRHTFPRLLLELGDRTFEDNVANVKFTGTAESNNAWDMGPWGDFPGAEGIGSSPWAEHFDTSVPEAECGAIEVPEYASGS